MDSDNVDALIYYNGSITREESGNVVFISYCDPLLSFVSQTMSFLELKSKISELFWKKRVKKIRYRYPFLNEVRVLQYKSIVISNDDHVLQMVRRSKKLEIIIELFVHFQEDRGEDDDEASPSNNIMNENVTNDVGTSSFPINHNYDVGRSSFPINHEYDVGTSSFPANHEYNEDENEEDNEPDCEENEANGDSDNDSEVLEHNHCSDDSGIN